jgi:hypothetical protein
MVITAARKPLGLARGNLCDEGRWQAKRRSVGALQLRQSAIRAAQQRHQRLNALATLGATDTCGVDAARLGCAGGRSGLFHMAVGQRVAKANIHSSRFPAMAGTPTA